MEAMDITEIRRHNARQIQAEVGGPAEFAKLIERSTGQVSHIVGPSPSKTIGNRLARHIEEQAGKPRGWLDVSHIKPEANAPYLRNLVVWENADELPEDAYVLLPRIEQGLSAGNGGPDGGLMDEMPAGQSFRASFIRRKGWSPETHKSMRCDGDSMEPTIQDGAPVIVDVSAKRIESGRVYAIMIDGEPRLKRLFRKPGGTVEVRSDNTSNRAYAPFDVPEPELHIIGRAVWTPVEL